VLPGQGDSLHFVPVFALAHCSWAEKTVICQAEKQNYFLGFGRVKPQQPFRFSTVSFLKMAGPLACPAIEAFMKSHRFLRSNKAEVSYTASSLS